MWEKQELGSSVLPTPSLQRCHSNSSSASPKRSLSHPTEGSKAGPFLFAKIGTEWGGSTPPATAPAGAWMGLSWPESGVLASPGPWELGLTPTLEPQVGPWPEPGAPGRA